MKPLDHDSVIAELNRLMAEELEAFLRYFQLRHRLREGEGQDAEKFFDGALEETAEHAGAIAAYIRKLGRTPHMKVAVTAGGGPISFREALSEALVFEQQALDAYKDLLPRVKGDAALEKFIREQVAVEGEHVEEITQLLKQKS
jgi:bacterioferritin (cytochrome b1)